MRDALSVLRKTLVEQFYIVNATFFLLITTLTFGFMSGVEHRALAEYFVASPGSALIPVIIWVIYLVKILRFNHHALGQKENSFLFNLSLLEGRSKLFAIASVIFLQLMPATLYCLFLITIAAQSGIYLVIGVFLSALLFLLATGTGLVYHELHNLTQERKVTFIKSFLDRKFTRNIIHIIIEWLIRTGFFPLAGSKLFACLLLYAVSNLYIGENFDPRLLALAASVAFAASLGTIISLHDFDNKIFPWLRNLPIRLPGRFGCLLVIVILLNIPEYAVVYRNFQDHLSSFEVLAACVFGLSVQMVFYSVLFIIRDHRNITRVMFAILVIWWVLILFEIPVVALSAINLGAAGGIYFRKYYTYQGVS